MAALVPHSYIAADMSPSIFESFCDPQALEALEHTLGLELDEHERFVFDSVGFNAQDQLVCKRCDGDGVIDLNPDGLPALETCWHCKGSGMKPLPTPKPQIDKKAVLIWRYSQIPEDKLSGWHKQLLKDLKEAA